MPIAPSVTSKPIGLLDPTASFFGEIYVRELVLELAIASSRSGDGRIKHSAYRSEYPFRMLPLPPVSHSPTAPVRTAKPRSASTRWNRHMAPQARRQRGG